MTYNKDQFKIQYFYLIGLFYSGQGYSLGSLVLLFPIYMLNELDASSRSEAVTIAAIMVIPWYVKFLFGLITDNFPILGMRRKPYLFIATISSLIGWSTIYLHEEISLMFVFSGFMISLGSALGDTVMDGQTIEITPEKFAGRLQGINWGSRGLGLGAAGYVSSNIVDTYSWGTFFLIVGSIGVVITLFAMILPELDIQNKMISDENSILSKLKNILIDIKELLSKADPSLKINYFLFSGFSLSIVLQITLIMETEFGYTLKEIGMTALIYAIGSFLGSILNGIITDRNDNLIRYTILNVAYSISIIYGITFVYVRDEILEGIFFFILGVFGGAFEAYQLKIIQKESKEPYESTIFAIFTGISNIGQFAMGGIVLVYIADIFRIPLLMSMQLLIITLMISYFLIYKFKFSKEILN